MPPILPRTFESGSEVGDADERRGGKFMEAKAGRQTGKDTALEVEMQRHEGRQGGRKMEAMERVERGELA